MLQGAVGYEALKAAIAAARASRLDRRYPARGSAKSRTSPGPGLAGIGERPLNPCATTYHSDEPLRLAGGLACLTVAKRRLSSATRPQSAPPASTLATKAPPGLQHLGGEIERRLDQAHGAQMVGLRMADRVGGHVGEDEVGRPAERLPEPVRRGIVHEVHLQDGRAVDRVGRQQVDADDRRLRRLLAHHLGPAAGRDAEVDDALLTPLRKPNRSSSSISL